MDTANNSTPNSIITYKGLKKLQEELEDLTVVRRSEIAQKIKEAREQGDLSENAEYDAAKEEQAKIWLNTQSWSIISGMADPEKARMAMDSVYEIAKTIY